MHDRSNATTTRVSVSTAGVQGNDASDTVAISGDGLLIAFESIATNLVAGDAGNVRDIFVRDRSDNSTIRASQTSNGIQSNDDSFIPSLSLDGQYISFHSFGTNYVANDTNDTLDVFVHGFANGAIERVSVSNSGAQGNDRSRAASLSEDGRFVAYSTIATNLVTPDTNSASDVLISDRGGPTSTLVAAVLPSSRSVVVGNAATAFATSSTRTRFRPPAARSRSKTAQLAIFPTRRPTLQPTRRSDCPIRPSQFPATTALRAS